MKLNTPKWIEVLQYFSLGFMWLLVLSIVVWILNLVQLSQYLHDAQNPTLGISLVVIPIFITLASVLTYVFFGLRRNAVEEDNQ